MPDEDLQNSVIDDLFNVGVIKFGKFTLKSGIISPIYIDLRILIGYPKLLRKITELIWQKIENNIFLNCICGVPYGALRYAGDVCTSHEIPMLMVRKEVKEHGTGKLIEGVIVENQTCLIIEDVVTTGSSILETAKLLREKKLIVKDAVVVIDREQGGSNMLQSKGIKLHSVVNLQQTLSRLIKTEKISQQTNDDVQNFLKNYNNVVMGDNPPAVEQRKRKSLADRMNQAKHVQLKRLYEIMSLKNTNLCVAVDLSDAQAILKLVASIGPEICMLKLHADIIDNFSDSFVNQLRNLSAVHNFLIMEDRKFSDIGNTVKAQLNWNVLKIAKWAHFVTIHSVAGPGVFEGLRQTCLDNNIGCFAVAEMSSKDALCNNTDYRQHTAQLAKDYSDIVVGFICQKRLNTDEDSFIYVTPGVHMESTGDDMKQNWRSPHQAIALDGNDVFIVGRGITEAPDPHSAAVQYKTAGWTALSFDV